MKFRLKNLIPRAEIITFTGELIDVFNLDPNKVHIEDIAHALANQCRWGGHTRKFYSVAEHSLKCKDYVLPNLEFSALMHDSAESYLYDLCSPIKRWMPFYRFLEHRILKVLSKKFGFQYPFPIQVKLVDKQVLALEYEDLIAGTEYNYFGCYQPEQAKQLFLMAFEHLTKKPRI